MTICLRFITSLQEAMATNKLFKHFCHLNVRKFSFAQRIIDDWNQLPTFLIESPDVMTFKTKLDIFWNAYRFHHL